MNIGILTGGGDVPGLNSCVKAAVYRATEAGHTMTGIRLGWGGLLNIDTGRKETIDRLVFPLTKANTRTIDRTGGTVRRKGVWEGSARPLTGRLLRISISEL